MMSNFINNLNFILTLILFLLIMVSYYSHIKVRSYYNKKSEMLYRVYNEYLFFKNSLAPIMKEQTTLLVVKLTVLKRFLELEKIDMKLPRIIDDMNQIRNIIMIIDQKLYTLVDNKNSQEG